MNRWIATFTAAIAIFLLLLVFLYRAELSKRSVTYSDRNMPLPSTATLAEHKKQKCFLLILVITAVESEKREAVRNTWLQEVKKLQPKVQAKFVIGTQGLTENQLTKLNAEEHEYHDILFLPDVVDSFNNLTRKTLGSILWIVDNMEISYVLKTDDDVYVLVRKFLEELEARESNIGLYWGHFHYNSPIKSSNEKYNTEHDWFLCKTYLPFALGGGYVLSADVVHAVARNAHMTQLYANEDTAVSVWISSFKLERKNDDRINVFNQTCKKEQILVHRIDAARIRKFHDHVLRNGTLC